MNTPQDGLIPHRVRHRTKPFPDTTPAVAGAAMASVIKSTPIESLVPYLRNARKHSQKQIAKLAENIDVNGFLIPIVADQQHNVVAGHGRLEAAKKLGMTHVPVITIDHLTPAQIKAFRIADNRLGELSTWDGELLAFELKELSVCLEDPQIIYATGFEIGEIDARIAILDVPAKVDPADEIIEPSQRPAISKLGDIWLLGKHRLLCGSSLDGANYDQLLQAALVRAAFSDPPYNVKISGHVSGLGKIQHREFGMASGEMPQDDFTAFLRQFLELTKSHSMPGSLHYVCMDAAHTFELLTAQRQSGLDFKTTCTWAKTNAGMGSFYRQQTEFVHVFKNDQSVPHINNIQLGRFGRHRTTLWTYAGVNTFRSGRDEDLDAHPTVKPWAMVAEAIKDCTGYGETVLDAFCGSGTTIIAAEKAGRIAYGIELDPLYVDVAIRRWEKVTKRSAIHCETGMTFAETEALAS